jgi:hypothetical protein
MFAAMQGDCAHRRAAINAEPGGPAIDVSAHQEVILSRTHQRQRFKLRSCSRGVGLVSRGQFANECRADAQDRQELSHKGEMSCKSHAAEINMVHKTRKRFRASTALRKNEATKSLALLHPPD